MDKNFDKSISKTSDALSNISNINNVDVKLKINVDNKDIDDTIDKLKELDKYKKIKINVTGGKKGASASKVIESGGGKKSAFKGFDAADIVNAGSKIIKTGGKSTAAIGKLAGALGKFGPYVAVILAVGAAIGKLAVKGYDAYKQTQELKAGFDNLGKSANVAYEYISKLNNADVGNIYSAAKSISKFTTGSLAKGVGAEQSAEMGTQLYNLALDIQASRDFTVPVEEIYNNLLNAVQQGTDDAVQYGIQASDRYVKAWTKNTNGIDLFGVEVSDARMQTERFNAVIAQGIQYSGQYASKLDTVGGRAQTLKDEITNIGSDFNRIFKPLLEGVLAVITPIVQGFGDMVEVIADFIDRSENFASGKGFTKSADAASGLTDEITKQNEALIKEGELIEKTKNALFGFDRLNVLGTFENSETSIDKYTGGVDGVSNNNKFGVVFPPSGGGGLPGPNAPATVPVTVPVEVPEFAYAIDGAYAFADVLEKLRIRADELNTSLDTVGNKSISPNIETNGIVDADVKTRGLNNLLVNVGNYIAKPIIDTASVLTGNKALDIALNKLLNVDSTVAKPIIDTVSILTGYKAVEILFNLLSKLGKSSTKTKIDSSDAKTASKNIRTAQTDYSTFKYSVMRGWDTVSPILKSIGKWMAIISGSILAIIGAASAASAIAGAIGSTAAGAGASAIGSTAAGASAIGSTASAASTGAKVVSIGSKASKVIPFTKGSGSIAAGLLLTTGLSGEHADGGITTRASLGVIGEAGTEAVIPLQGYRGREALKLIADAANGGDEDAGKVTNYNININASNIIEDEYTTRKFARKIANNISEVNNSDGNIDIGLGV